jgi:hypothetical protein
VTEQPPTLSEDLHLDPRMKAWIDSASYESLLSRWRNAPIGSPWFQGAIADYYQRRMSELRNANPEEHVRASKSIGW